MADGRRPRFTRNERRTIGLITDLRARPSTPSRRRAIRRRKVTLALYRKAIRAAVAVSGWNRGQDRKARYHGLIDVYNADPIGTTWRKLYGRPASTLWGGSRAVIEEIIDIVDGRAPVGSRKRRETYGNPDSDHHVSQRTADAVDFRIANAHWLKNEISRKLGGPSSLPDYGTFNVRRNGHTFRVQIIAGTHGTGPHLHVGVRRVR